MFTGKKLNGIWYLLWISITQAQTGLTWVENI